MSQIQLVLSRFPKGVDLRQGQRQGCSSVVAGCHPFGTMTGTL